MSTARKLAARLRSGAGRSVLGSLGASGGLQLLVIASGVLVARSLGPEDRGYLALLIVISTLCAILGTLGLPAALTYYIARDPGHARRITSSLALVGALQLAGVLVVQIAALALTVGSGPPRVHMAAAISLLLPPGILALHFGLAILQGQQRFTPFNILRITPTTTYVVGIVALYVLDFVGIVPFMALWASVNFVGGFITLAFAVHGLPRTTGEAAPSRREMLRFGLKALLGTLSPVDVVRIDQAAVGLFLSPVALGYYVVAQGLSNLPRLAATSIGMVAYPQVAAERDRSAARRTMWRYFFIGFALSAVVVGALELMAGRLIVLFFGTEFAAATAITQILLLASLFMAGRRVLTDGINGIGSPGLGTIAEVASWIFLVPTVAVLLPWYGAEGVALALALSWGASLLLLVAMALVGEHAWEAGGQRLARVTGRLAALPTHLSAPQVLAVTGAVLLAVLGGLAAAFLPHVAIGLAAALALGLFFAFGRKTFAEHLRSLRSRVALDDAPEPPDGAASGDLGGHGFTAPRRLYYGGILLLAMLTLRAGGQVTVSDLLFLFSFLLASAELVILRRRVPMKLPFLLLIGIAVFSLGGLLSTFDSYAPLQSIAVILRLIFLTVLWFWLGTVVLRRQEHVTRAIGFWVASVAICGGAAILQLVVSSNIVPGTSLQWGRATGFTLHPNDLGGLTAIAFVPAIMLASRARSGSGTRAYSYLVLLLVAAGLILSGSVGALIAAAVATIVWLAFQRTSIHSLLAFATLAACVVALITLQSIRGAANPLERLNAVTGTTSQPGGSGSVHLRVDTYRIAVARIQENPLLGVGLDLKSVTRPYGVESWEFDVHNLVIGTWYKTGIIGLAGMLIALFAILRTTWITVLRSKSSEESRIVVALASSFVAFLVFAMSEPVLFSRFGWIAAALIIAVRAVQLERESPETAAYPREEPRTVAAFLQP